jgi:hypothetical protein
MKHRGHRSGGPGRDDLNRGDYRDDFGPEGRHRFAGSSKNNRERHQGDYQHRQYGDDARTVRGERNRRPSERVGRGWRPFGDADRERSRAQGGYGSEFGAWRSGVGVVPASFGFGPDEAPDPGGFRDDDWQVTRPARGRGAWAGDWENENYRGRGPRNYKRSDDRIREEVCERLTDDRAVDATDIVVQVQNGEVTLTGDVSTREQKRRAGECAERVHGVDDVFNQLRVEQSDAQRQRWRVGVR